MIKAKWSVHTPQLLREILNNNGTAILSVPINMFGKLLAQVADRAIQLNDPELNALMCRLTLYEEADPHSEKYDKELVEKTILLAENKTLK